MLIRAQWTKKNKILSEIISKMPFPNFKDSVVRNMAWTGFCLVFAVFTPGQHQMNRKTEVREAATRGWDDLGTSTSKMTLGTHVDTSGLSQISFFLSAQMKAGPFSDELSERERSHKGEGSAGKELTYYFLLYPW